MGAFTKEDLINNAIELLDSLKKPSSAAELNMEVRRFRNKIKESELMPDWKIDECVARLHDFLLDFHDLD